MVYSHLGQYPKALEYFQQALAIRKQIGDRSGVGNSLNSIGSIYDSLGQYPKALEYYQQALAIDQEIGDRSGVGNSLNSIGLVYRRLGQYPKALEYYQQALAIRKQIGDRSGVGTTLNNIGAIYDRLEQYRTVPQSLGVFSASFSHSQRNWRSRRCWTKPQQHWRNLLQSWTVPQSPSVRG